MILVVPPVARPFLVALWLIAYFVMAAWPCRYVAESMGLRGAWAKIVAALIAFFWVVTAPAVALWLWLDAHEARRP